MATGDIYQLVLKYRWDDSIDCSNAFYYQHAAGTASIAADFLNDAFISDVFPAIDALAPTAISFISQDIVNYRNPADYQVAPFGTQTGNRTSESTLAPSFLAIQYVSGRAEPGTRSARKRFPFLFENDFAKNMLDLSAPVATIATNLATAMSNIISNGGNTFTPVCVKRPLILGVNPGYSFVIPPRPYVLSQKLSTQDTRKS